MCVGGGQVNHRNTDAALVIVESIALQGGH